MINYHIKLRTPGPFFFCNWDRPPLHKFTGDGVLTEIENSLRAKLISSSSGSPIVLLYVSPLAQYVSSTLNVYIDADPGTLPHSVAGSLSHWLRPYRNFLGSSTWFRLREATFQFPLDEFVSSLMQLEGWCRYLKNVEIMRWLRAYDYE